MDSFDHWTDRFPAGERVQFLDNSGDVEDTERVFTQGEDYLHFYFSSDSPLVEQLKISTYVTVRSSNSSRSVSGYLTCLDHRPTFYEQLTGTGDVSDERAGRLVRFEPDPDSLPGNVNRNRKNVTASTLDHWLKLLHLRSLPATVVPILLGFVYPLWMGWNVSLLPALLALAGGVFLHSASNLHNDLSDYHYALLHGHPVERNPVNDGKVNPSGVWMVALLLYGLAILPGLPLLLLRGTELLIVGIFSFLIACFYVLYRHSSAGYRVFQDFLMFVLMGPLMAVAASIASSGHWDWKLCVAALPVGLFVALLLHEHDIHNIPIDRRAGATTLAILLGFRKSKMYYQLLTFAGYGLIGILVVLKVIPLWSLLTYLTIPLAARNLKLLNEVQSPLNPRLGDLRSATVRLMLTFGVTYTISFLTGIIY